MNVFYPGSQLSPKPLVPRRRVICQAHYGARDWGFIFCIKFKSVPWRSAGNLSCNCSQDPFSHRKTAITLEMYPPVWICLLFLRHSVTIGGLCQSRYTCRYRSLFTCEHTNTRNDLNILLPKVINPSCLFIQQENQLFVVNLVFYVLLWIHTLTELVSWFRSASILK